MTKQPLKVYMAGPDVFLDNALEVADQKREILKAHGFTGLHPFDNNVMHAGMSPDEIARTIFRENVGLMDQADVILANLTPFRGVSADAGTVFEVGYMYAKNKPIFAYTNVEDVLFDRVNSANGVALTCDADGLYWDKEQLNVENFGLKDNLMIDCAVLAQDKMLAHEQSRFLALKTPEGETLSALAAFEKTVSLMADVLLFDSAD